MDPKAKVFLVPVKILFFFRLFGVFPLSRKPTCPVANFVQRLLSFGHCLLIICIFSCSIFFAPKIFYTTYAIGLFVDMIQTLAPIIAHLVICIEASQRVTSYRLFWETFERIFDILQRLQGPQTRNLRNLYRRSGFLLLIFTLIPFAFELRILWGIFGNYWFYSRLASEFSFFGCRLSYLQLCLKLQIVQWILQLLEKETRSLSNESRSQLKSVEFEMRTGVTLKRIQLLQKAMSGVMELTSHLNNSYRI